MVEKETENLNNQTPFFVRNKTKIGQCKNPSPTTQKSDGRNAKIGWAQRKNRMGATQKSDGRNAKIAWAQRINVAPIENFFCAHAIFQLP